MVDRALALADSEGLESVTLRRLAKEFGVTPMALYWHVRNKEELLEAMGDRLFDGVAGSAEQAVAGAGGSWSDQMLGLVQVLLEALRTHPGSVSLAAQRILECDQGRELTEAALAVLRSGGLSVEQAADAAHQVMLTVITLVGSRSGPLTALAEPERTAALTAKRAALENLPADRFPHLVEAAGALTDCVDEGAYYRNGIQLVVAGAQALAGRGGS